MGYGTQILELIKNNCKTSTIVLNIEPLDENSPNKNQRIRRINFYQKNGLSATKYVLCYEDTEYRILSSDGSLSIDNYKHLLSRISDEFVQSKIYAK